MLSGQNDSVPLARASLRMAGNGLAVRGRVIQAIILREMTTRFGRHALGYTWAFVEPLFHILVFLILFHASDRRVAPGMTMETFLLTGVVPWLMFLNTQNRVLRAVTSNKPLLVYPMVTPLDCVLARAILEYLTYTAVFVVFALGLILFGVPIDIASLPGMVAASALLTVMGMGSGMVIAAARLYLPWIEQITGPVFRLLYFVSGVFFTLNELPPRLRDLIAWNPIAQLIDLVRSGFFTGYTSHHAAFTFPAAIALAMLLLGLLANKATEARAGLQ